MGFGLDWEELMAWPLAWHLFLAGAEKVGNTNKGIWLWPHWAVQENSEGKAVCISNLSGLSPLLWIERKALVPPPTMSKITSSVP